MRCFLVSPKTLPFKELYRTQDLRRAGPACRAGPSMDMAVCAVSYLPMAAMTVSYRPSDQPKVLPMS